MDRNDDEWILESDALDESDDELILDNPSSPDGFDDGAEDEEIESEEEAEQLTFDVALPLKHAYLGSNLQEARGHTLMDLEGPEGPVNEPGTLASSSNVSTSSRSSYDRNRGQICQIPILHPYSGVSMALVPGQTLPLTLFHPQAVSMLRFSLERGRTFGVVAIRNNSEDEEEERSTYFLPLRRNRHRIPNRRFSNEEYPVWDVGTTAEIYEFQGEVEDSMLTDDENRMVGGFILKAKGSQRFRLLDIHRQVDGNLLAKVQILPEVILPHPLHECHIGCLDHLRHESAAGTREHGFGETIHTQSHESDHESRLVENICSLINEKRKGDDSSTWERICEVKRLAYERIAGRERSAFRGFGLKESCGQEGHVSNFDRNKMMEQNIKAQGDPNLSSLSYGNNEINPKAVSSVDVIGSTNAEMDEKQGTLENVACGNIGLKTEQGKGIPKGKGVDSKLQEEDRSDDPSKVMFRNSVRVDRRWCRKRDSSLTAWPEWIYSLYDGDALVKRMHQEFKALHLSKKKDKPMLLRSSLGLKSSEKGLSRSFPCLSKDPVELSFWVAQNLPLDDKQRVKLLRMNSAIQRLRWELDILEKCHRLTCCNCGQKIADQRHVFCMSVAGPQGTYVNPGGYVHEALTLSKTRGLKVVTHPPSTLHSWFPGYAWSIVECSRCSQHMGWLFTVAPGDNQQLRPQHFWGLCRKSLVAGQTKMSEDDLLL